MPTFVYEARDATGQLRKDTIEAANLRAATQRLQEQRMTVIQIKAKAAGGGAEGLAGLLSRMKKVDEQALTVFSRQFATMINAGLAMVRCLDILSEQTEDKKLKETLIQVRRDVEGGSTLSNSLAKHPQVFSMLYISMVKAGEMGGVLDEVLERLAEIDDVERAGGVRVRVHRLEVEGGVVEFQGLTEPGTVQALHDAADTGREDVVIEEVRTDDGRLREHRPKEDVKEVGSGPDLEDGARERPGSQLEGVEEPAEGVTGVGPRQLGGRSLELEAQKVPHERRRGRGELGHEPFVAGRLGRLGEPAESLAKRDGIQQLGSRARVHRRPNKDRFRVSARVLAAAVHHSGSVARSPAGRHSRIDGTFATTDALTRALRRDPTGQVRRSRQRAPGRPDRARIRDGPRALARPALAGSGVRLPHPLHDPPRRVAPGPPLPHLRGRRAALAGRLVAVLVDVPEEVREVVWVGVGP